MTVKEVHNPIRTLEFRQDPSDPDYGSCLWARFSFNLDRYELSIMSDCGNYGYKWAETPEHESFLELMARCHGDYILNKISKQNVFDYEETKACAYDNLAYEEEDREKLDEIFENIESDYIPREGSDFVRLFDEYNDGYFADTFELPNYTYPYDAIKISQVFELHIKPAIRELLKEQEEDLEIE